MTTERLNPDLDRFLHPWYIFPDGCGAAVSPESESDYKEDLLKNTRQTYVCLCFYYSNAIVASASADMSKLSNMILCYLKYAIYNLS